MDERKKEQVKRNKLRLRCECWQRRGGILAPKLFPVWPKNPGRDFGPRHAESWEKVSVGKWDYDKPALSFPTIHVVIESRPPQQANVELMQSDPHPEVRETDPTVLETAK